MKTFDELEEGKFYIPIFERIEPEGEQLYERYHTDSPFYQYIGDGEFVTEEGDAVDGFYDHSIGFMVAVDSPCGFIQ
jgi:hypothetical protein